MNFKALSILIVVIGFLGSCENKEISTTFLHASNLSPIDTSFQSFVNSIPVLDAGFTLSNDEDFEHIDLQNKFIPDGAALIGRLNPIDNYEFIIYSYPADIRLPILEVYNSEGVKVNQQTLFKYGYCKLGSGPDNHDAKLSSDGTKFYLHTSCIYAYSAFDYDSVVVRDLISH